MDLTESPLEAVSRHPWERARAGFFLDLARSALAGRTGAAILDLGAGDAYFADVVSRGVPDAKVTCMDLGYDAPTMSRLARLYPHLELVPALPPGRIFDAILALDVIEHVADDLALLRDTARAGLAAGGAIVLSVPAHRWLWSSHDVGLRHHRRYAHRELGRVVARAGLALEAEGGLFASLVIPRALAVARERLGFAAPAEPSEGAIAWSGGPALTRLALSALRADARLCLRAASAGLVVPGLSYWAVARKTGGPA